MYLGVVNSGMHIARIGIEFYMSFIAPRIQMRGLS